MIHRSPDDFWGQEKRPRTDWGREAVKLRAVRWEGERNAARFRFLLQAPAVDWPGVSCHEVQKKFCSTHTDKTTFRIQRRLEDRLRIKLNGFTPYLFCTYERQWHVPCQWVSRLNCTWLHGFFKDFIFVHVDFWSDQWFVGCGWVIQRSVQQRKTACMSSSHPTKIIKHLKKMFGFGLWKTTSLQKPQQSCPLGFLLLLLASSWENHGAPGQWYRSEGCSVRACCSYYMLPGAQPVDTILYRHYIDMWERSIREDFSFCSNTYKRFGFSCRLQRMQQVSNMEKPRPEEHTETWMDHQQLPLFTLRPCPRWVRCSWSQWRRNDMRLSSGRGGFPQKVFVVGDELLLGIFLVIHIPCTGHPKTRGMLPFQDPLRLLSFELWFTVFC